GQPVERALVGLAWLALALDVGHPVRHPQTLEAVRLARAVLVLDLVRHRRQTCIRRSTADTISAIASATGTPLRCSPLRYRNETAPLDTSSSPASSMNGTFCFCAVLIFFCMRSSAVSTSTRMPRSRSWAATPSR